MTLEYFEAKKQKKLKPCVEGDKTLTGREGVGIGEPAGCAGERTREDWRAFCR